MQQIALVIHVALAIGVIGLVLIQHGKGADAGAAFGSGASSTVFGARGSASFLTKLTTILAGLFFLTSLTLFYLAAQRDGGDLGSVTDSVVTEEAAPAATDLPGGVTDAEADAVLPAAAEEVLPKPAE
ncbi:MAG: preprotein translocase subunit SecG [Granulosicoccaceae bacterium]